MSEELLRTVRLRAEGLRDQQPEFHHALLRACAGYETGDESFELPYLLQLRRYPVSVDEFLFSPDYLNKTRKEIFPEVLKELRQINNPGSLRVVNPFTEAVFTGGIGSAKSTTALYTVAYQVYVLSCFRNPHHTFHLDVSSEIVFVFQSLNGEAAKSVDYDRFYAMVKDSLYFTSVFPYDTKVKSKLRFPNRIEVKPIGTDHGTIGQNVVGGLIDELNFMSVIQNSKRDADRGVYDQAKTIYNSISRRRKSRFAAQGRLPGILCLVSSKRYPGEFTDQKIAEAKTDPTIYIYDKRVWEVKPEGTYTNGWFNLFTGDSTRKARILEDGEEPTEQERPLIMPVPNDFKRDFELDMAGSLRDVAGVSTLARHPFISHYESISKCLGRKQSVLNLEESDLESTQVVFYKERFRDLSRMRWCHVDLGLTSDSAGIACGYVKRFVEVDGGAWMPEMHFDFLLRVKPPPNKEIQFWRLRRMIALLRQHGLPIKWVSFDSFQSADSVQLLRQQGFSTGRLSMDLTALPYNVLKTAFYHERIHAPAHAHGRMELMALEQSSKTGKIDHPPNGSKDIADAMAGVVYGLTNRREIWAEFGVPVAQSVQLMKEIKTHESTTVDALRGGADYDVSGAGAYESRRAEKARGTKDAVQRDAVPPV